MPYTKANSTPNEANSPAWVRSYFVAVMESNRKRALPQIELAQKAILARVEELRSQPASHPGELQDLNSALVYLGILLQHIGKETGNLLWD
jgi:hypothetical protein